MQYSQLPMTNHVNFRQSRLDWFRYILRIDRRIWRRVGCKEDVERLVIERIMAAGIQLNTSNSPGASWVSLMPNSSYAPLSLLHWIPYHACKSKLSLFPSCWQWLICKGNLSLRSKLAGFEILYPQFELRKSWFMLQLICILTQIREKYLGLVSKLGIVGDHQMTDMELNCSLT